MQEGPAAGRQPYTLHFMHPAAAHALVDGVVLAINREQRLALLAGFTGDQLSGRYHAFLVGEANFFSCAYRFIRRFQAGHAHNRADYKIHFLMSRNPNRTRLPENNSNVALPFSFEPLARSLRILLGSEREHLWPPLARLFQRQFNIIARRHGDKLKPLRIFFDHIKRATANGTGGTEDANALHLTG